MELHQLWRDVMVRKALFVAGGAVTTEAPVGCMGASSSPLGGIASLKYGSRGDATVLTIYRGELLRQAARLRAAVDQTLAA